jgi:hypothetical protein
MLFLLLVGCGVKKRAVIEQPTETVTTWHTCLIQGARGTITSGDDSYSASVTMQTVHDSMLVISIMPMLGMELMRIEATPLQLTAIDKYHGQYAVTTYAELNKNLTPSINWDILQQLCTAELPTGNVQAHLQYMYGTKTTIDLIIDYVPRQLDVPVRVKNQRLDKYTKINIWNIL